MKPQTNLGMSNSGKQKVRTTRILISSRRATRPNKRAISKRLPVALAPEGVAWVVDDHALSRYKRTLSFEDIKEVARTSVSASVFICEGFRIRAQSDANDFVSLNGLTTGPRSLSQFKKVATTFKADFERLISHIGFDRPPALDFERERHLLEKALGRRLNFSPESEVPKATEKSFVARRGQSSQRGRHNRGTPNPVQTVS